MRECEAKKRQSTFVSNALLDEPVRSRGARRLAEAALVRVVHHYGTTPEFVLLGGLVPEILCSGSEYTHAGTTDIDVQVDLEIAAGAVNTRKLERALLNAEFTPTSGRTWRWETGGPSGGRAVVKFELLSDLPNVPANVTVNFEDCENLGAANLRGTGVATRDSHAQVLSARVGETWLSVEVRVTGVAGFLLAKAVAAHHRGVGKDWYDIAFVLLHNDAGGPVEAARITLDLFREELGGALRTSLLELADAFADTASRGTLAFANQFVLDHPDENYDRALADAVVAVRTFCDVVLA